MTNRIYHYVGSKEIREAARSAPEGKIIRSTEELLCWLKEVDTEVLPDGTFIATFVIDTQGEFRVAPRRSEHVACASGGPVLSAGEVTLAVENSKSESQVSVVEISNQSTGFCPEPESWPSVAIALDTIPLERPGSFTREIVFRLCQGCNQRNIVKDCHFVCELCDAELSQTWNFA